MKKIKVGQIGNLHDHSKDIMITLKRFPELFEIVGFVPEDESEYEKKYPNYVKNPKAYYSHPTNPEIDVYEGIPKMTADELVHSGVDAVFVETFEKELVKQAKKCVEAGIHVHIDKPAGIDADELMELLRLAKKNNTVVHMGYMYRYNPSVKKALELYRDGKIGEIHSVETTMSTSYPPEKLNWLSNFKGGMMYFLGCHIIDIITLFCGVPDEIIPVTESAYNDRGGEDYCMAVFKYKNGISYAKLSANEFSAGSRRKISIIASDATLDIAPTEQTVSLEDGFWLKTGITTMYKDESKVSESDINPFYERFDRYEEMIKEFAMCVSGETENPYTYEHEMRLQLILLAACGYDIDYKQEIIL